MSVHVISQTPFRPTGSTGDVGVASWQPARSAMPMPAVRRRAVRDFMVGDILSRPAANCRARTTGLGRRGVLTVPAGGQLQLRERYADLRLILAALVLVGNGGLF